MAHAILTARVALSADGARPQGGIVLKEVTDLHAGACVSHLRFLHPARPHGISVDSTGATHLIQFHRILVSHSLSRQCLLDGKAGPVTRCLLYTSPSPRDAHES
eukprot:666500-Prymnesium_polylepis.2